MRFMATKRRKNPGAGGNPKAPIGARAMLVGGQWLASCLFVANQFRACLNLLPTSSTGEKRFRERFGLDFEQFAVGQKFQHRPGLTLSQQDSRDECLDTLNAQMLHFDEQFAGHTEWKKCLMVSTC